MTLDDHVLDWAREERTGVAEAVLAAGKTPMQLVAIAKDILERDGRMLVTKLSPEGFAALEALGCGVQCDPESATAVIGRGQPVTQSPAGAVAVVAAGTSDLLVAREACQTLAFGGVQATLVADVGVAGLWRLAERLAEIRAARVVIAAAGMEGALFSVLAGLVRAPVIAVPTSVGYGVAQGGRTALHAALSSCAPGVVVVNIDNGFGAACAALKMLEAMRG